MKQQEQSRREESKRYKAKRNEKKGRRAKKKYQQSAKCRVKNRDKIVYSKREGFLKRCKAK